MPVRLSAEPASALVDEPVVLGLEGLEAGQQVTLHASARDGLEREWTSSADFVADLRGRIEVPDPMQLLWSLALAADEEAIPFVKDDVEPILVSLCCKSTSRSIATARLERCFVAPGVDRIEVRERGLVATFFRPPGAGPFPAVIWMGGSDGGLHEQNAAVLASRGYAALALAYFGFEHLPAMLAELPLEYFATAIDWLNDQPGIDSERLVTMGQSRGGELALLLGATFPAVKGVIGYVPSGVVHAGLGQPDAPPAASWTLAGKPFAFANMDPTAIDWTPPIRLMPGFLAGLEDVEAATRAEIPVERIGGPVLLISGRDDAMWPSTELADIAVRRFSRESFPHSVAHHAYPGAGHAIRLPYLPTSLTRMLHPVTGQLYELGGSAVANAHASREAWSRVLDFLASL